MTDGKLTRIAGSVASEDRKRRGSQIRVLTGEFALRIPRDKADIPTHPADHRVRRDAGPGCW